MDNVHLAAHLDFANHHPNAVEADIKFICDQVTEHGFNAAFMNPSWVEPARQSFHYSGKIGTIVAFSLGQDTLDIKIAAAKRYAENGANELDTLLNISLIKEAKWDQVLSEMQAIIDTVKALDPQVIIKFIPETGYLTPAEIKKVAELMVTAKADFFKTCTGLGPRGATLDDVRYVKEAIGDAIPIKVAGGIDTRAEADSFLAAGASRIGTSHALDIIGQTQPSLTLPATFSNE